MGEPSREEYKIQSFDAETQQLLKTALKDPGAVDLEKVANVIVDHSLQDCVFSKEAGRMCYAIIQAESKQAGQSVFRRGLLNRLQQEYQAREQLRARSLQGWVCYVTFICNIFDYLRVNNIPMMALVNPVYDCLFRLAQPDSLSKEEEVGGPSPGTSTEGCRMDSPAQPSVSPLLTEVFEDCVTSGAGLWGCLRPVRVIGQAARSGIYPIQRAAKTYWLSSFLLSQKANL
ncbi:MIF4G domain-containing protein isoform X1 [Pongo abelii]|uniref:MIF4G domain-containing protein isoform X1 n=1 Tax=Pongo abelii TaxID=9601 RepID=UPI0004F4094F|nr:MIF4G domain-containing protein isoform X1 [Pongo abelii]